MLSRYFIYLFFTSFILISCGDKETVVEVEEIIFPDLGSDGPYISGQKYSGVNNYIEYYSGNLPVIIAAPHGGAMMPAQIPDRTVGTMVTDKNTKELSKAVIGEKSIDDALATMNSELEALAKKDGVYKN